MHLDEHEEALLKSVALQNARAVLLARRRAEQESEASKNRITSILESIADGFFVLNKDWRFTYLNRRTAEFFSLLGKSRDQLMDMVFWDVVPGVAGTPVEQNFRRAVQDQAPLNFEFGFPALSRSLGLRVFPGPDGLSVYCQDITDQKESDRLRGHLAAVVESSDDAIISMTLDTIISTWNKGAESMFGYTAAEAVGRSITMLIPPSLDDEEPRILKRLLAGERIEHYETVRVRKDGTPLNVSLTVSPIYNASRAIVGVSKISRDITPRKQAEENLVRTNQILTSVLNSVTDAFVALDHGWRITYLNPSAASIFLALGRDPTHALGQNHWSYFPELLGTNLESEYRRAVRDRVNVAFELFYAPATKWFDIQANPTSTGLSVFFRDTTERKRGQDALRRSEEELRALANSIPQLAWMANPDGHIFWYNRKWFDYTGTTLPQMEGWGWRSVHDPDILPSVIERWNLSLSTGAPFEMEFPLRGADGVFRWFLTRVNPVRDAHGNVVRWFGTNTDVEEVRQARLALKEETRLLELLNHTGTVIGAELNLETVVQTVTDSATQSTGAKFGAFFYNVINAEGESFLLFTLSGAPREAFEKFGNPRATPLFGPTFRGEPPIRVDDIRKDPRYGRMEPHRGMPKGHLPVVSYLAVPVVSRTGEVIGGLFFGHPEPGVFTERAEKIVVGMAAQAAIAIDNARLFDKAQREIAERKRIEGALLEAQAELRQHATLLEEQVAERTARLRETIQELEAFSYSVSHDLRSPLRAMQGYADALLADYQGKLDESGHEYLQRIRRAAARMDLLIQDVLAYSKVAKGDINLRPVDLETVIRDVIQNYPALQSKDIAVNIRKPIPRVLGHEAYLTQIVSNLLNNAVKFVPPGSSPSISISAREDGDKAIVAFTDNGIGIAPEHHEQIFQIFGRVHSEKKFEGTGIGLAIAKKAAERMGGSIAVESTLGHGSTFSVLLLKAPR